MKNNIQEAKTIDITTQKARKLLWQRKENYNRLRIRIFGQYVNG